MPALSSNEKFQCWHTNTTGKVYHPKHALSGWALCGNLQGVVGNVHSYLENLCHNRKNVLEKLVKEMGEGGNRSPILPQKPYLLDPHHLM